MKHHRRSIRLPGYDYSAAGAYFITICTKDRIPLFGEIVNGEMRLNECGRIVDNCWGPIPEHFPHVQLDAFVVMPDHIHGVVWITSYNDQIDSTHVGANNYSPLPTQNGPVSICPRGTSRSIGSVIRGFKIGVTMDVHKILPGIKIWQRNYYEHIIRNESGLSRIRQYIIDNPLKWDADHDKSHHEKPFW